MNSRNKAVPAVLRASLLLALSGCASLPAPVVGQAVDGAASSPAQVAVGDDRSDDAERETAQAAAPQVLIGTGQLINTEAAKAPRPIGDSEGKATFNFEGESLHAVVKAILGDLLKQNYVIAPGIQGSVTLTAQSVDSDQAFSLLEMVLGWNNAVLVWDGSRYSIVASDKALPGQLALRSGPPSDARGYEVRAVPLGFVSAAEMEKLLKPYARANAVISVDSARNMIVLAGTRAELENYLQTIAVFDVDWLAGMSVGVFPLRSADAAKIVGQLNEIFGEAGQSPLAGLVRLMPLEDTNSVLVITPQPKYLKDVESWISRLDSSAEGVRLYTYEAKYVEAGDLGEKLSEIFGAGNGSASPVGRLLAPGLEPITLSSVSTPASRASEAAARSGSRPAPAREANAGRRSDDGVAVGGGDIAVTAVEESNTLLIRTTPGQWESIQRALERIDTMPLQVHVEAQVIEVQLGGQLSYGVSWFFEDAIEGGLRNLARGRDIVGDLGGAIRRGGTDAGSPFGATWSFLGPNWHSIIELLDSKTDLRILSTPSILVRNNVEAQLNVGTSLPVVSTSFNPIVDGGNGPGTGTYSSIQYVQTGLILKVKPRVSSEGVVFMEISQEISSPGDTVGAGGNLPINTRNLTTEAAVRSGETVMLAGLITDNQDRSSSGLPGLSRIPVLGGLFGRQSRNDLRTEVVVFITPTVIRDPQEARRRTLEYGRRFRALEPLNPPPTREESVGS